MHATLIGYGEAGQAFDVTGDWRADEVLTSLDASEKAISWAEKAAYNRERMAVHGLRRAAEMEESVKTLQALGVEPVITQGTVRRQREAAKEPGKDQ